MLRIKLFHRYPLHVAMDRATGYTAFLFCALAFPVLYIVSRYNYNLFHSIADIFTIVIASMVFVVAWNSRQSLDNHYLLYAGIGFLSFAFLDLFHVLGNKNMGVFPQYGNLGPALYIASRYVLSISLVTAPLFINRKLRVAPVFAAYSLVTLLVLLSVFYWQNFPVCFAEGVRLTSFKVVSDYIICLILLGALALLLLNRRSFDTRVLRLLSASILLSIATGLAFTLYADPFGVMNAIGHFFQIVSFYLIYLAVIETGLTKPQNILFRKLKQSEEKYRNLFQNMAEEVHFWQIVRDEAGQIQTWKLVDVNPPTLRTWGRNTVEEIRGKTTDEIFGPGATEHYMPAVQKIMTEGVPHSFEDYFPNLDRYFRFTSVPLGDYFITTGADITSIKKAELAIQESETRLRRIAKAGRIGFFEWNAAKNITYWSPEHYEIFGYEPGSQVSWDRWLQSVHPEDCERVLANAARLLECGRAGGQMRDHKDEYRLIRPDGSVVWLESDVSLDMVGGEAILRGSVRDITERKQAEEALRESEQRFRLALKNAPVSVAVQDRDLRYIWAYNQRSARPDQIIGHFDEEIFTADEAAHISAIKRRVLEEGIEHREQMWLDRPTGPMYLDICWEPIRDQAGSITGVASATVDLTPIKLAEQALQESEERFRKIFEHAPTGIAILDWQGRFIQCNPSHEEILGFTEEQLRSMDFASLVHPEDREANLAEVRRLQSGELPFFEIENRYIRKNGQPVWVHKFVSLLPDTTGRPAYIIALVTDITGRKQAEEALEKMRFILSEGQKIAHLGTFEYIAETRTTVWSEEEYRIYGLDPAGSSPEYNVMLKKCIHPDDAALLHQTFSAAMQSGSIYELEHRIVRPDGGVRWVYDRAHPYFGENGKLLRYIGATLDITERKQAEEVLKKAHNELEQRVQERTSELSETVERLRVENIHRKQLEDTLRESENRVRFFASQCLSAQETERGRVAAELHDSVAASLGALRLGIDKIADEMKQGQAGPGSLQDLGSKVVEINNEVRRIMADLRPSILDDLGIIAAMKWFCREYQKIYSHISVENEIGISEQDVPDSLKTPIFRICQ